MTTSIRAVCFDLDDTLYPYRQYARCGLAAAADLLAAETGERYHEQLHELYVDGGITHGTFDVLAERNGLPDRLVADCVEAFHTSDEPLTPYPATEKALEQLTPTYACGVITDGRGGREKLRRLGLESSFDHVVVGPEHSESKESRVVFDRMLSVLSVSPAETVYVGDDPRVDFRHPNRLGMTTIRVRTGRYADADPPAEIDEPDYDCPSLTAVPTIVASAASIEAQAISRVDSDPRSEDPNVR